MNVEDIHNVTFDRVMRGYKPEEVDEYLDKVAAELEKLQTEKADLQAQSSENEKKMAILAEKVAQFTVVVDAHESAAVDIGEFHHIVRFPFFEHPFGNQLAVAHVSFLNILARLNTHELGHQTVEHVFVVFGLVCVGAIEQAEFDQFGIGQVI